MSSKKAETDNALTVVYTEGFAYPPADLWEADGYAEHSQQSPISKRMMYSVVIDGNHRDLGAGDYLICKSCYDRHIFSFQHPSRYRSGVVEVQRDYLAAICQICHDGDLHDGLGDAQPVGGAILETKGSCCGIKTYLKPHGYGLIDFNIRKHRCARSWCTDCFKGYIAPLIATRLRGFNWRSVRHIVLTIDPDKYNGPEEAFNEVAKKRAIAELCRNIERTHGREINDWIRLLEWHSNGFPHWHLIVEMSVQGRAAQIGQDIIHHYWPYGKIVREKYVESEHHWDNICGYLQKKGYLTGGEGKTHQLVLPDWLADSTKKIPRYSSMRKPSGDRSAKRNKEGKVEGIGKPFKLSNETRKTHKIALAECGSKTKVVFSAPGFSLPGNRLPGITLEIPYAVIKSEQDDLVYRDGLGLCKSVNWAGLWTFVMQYREFMSAADFLNLLETFDFYEFTPLT